jgi:hypothetical protein
MLIFSVGGNYDTSLFLNLLRMARDFSAIPGTAVLSEMVTSEARQMLLILEIE